MEIDPAALSWRFSRSSGPGGQHVNTTESQVELRCDVALALGLASEAVRARVLTALGSEVRVVASTERSQLRNRAEAWRRLAEQLDDAARPPRTRRATRPSRGAKERRLDAKRQTGERKSNRRWKPDE